MESVLMQFLTVTNPLGPLPLAQAQGGGDFASFMPLIVVGVGLFLLFQVIVRRPEQAEQRKREEHLNALGKGDQIITIGGIHATVESVDKGKGTVMISIANKVSIRLNKSAIASVTPRKKGKGETEESDADEAAAEKAGSGGGKKK